MSNGILTLFDPDLYTNGNLGVVGVVPSVFPAGTGTIGSGAPLPGISVIRPQVFLTSNPSEGGFGFSGYIGSMGYYSTFGFFPGYPTPPVNAAGNGIVLLFAQNAGASVRVSGHPTVVLTRVPGTPSNPTNGHVEVRLSYTVVTPTSINWSAKLYLNGILTYAGSASGVAVSVDLIPSLRAGLSSPVSVAMKHMVFYDTDIITTPLGITKVRQITTNSPDLNPPVNDATSITVLPAGVNLNLDGTNLGNVLAGALILRATPNTPGEVAELVATVSDAGLTTQEAFATGTLPLFSVGDYYFPLTEFSADDLYGGRLNLKSLEPEAWP